ncbi:hypothetical protein ACNS7O_13870 [Haloferacaceae archaeon DSL9]
MAERDADDSREAGLKLMFLLGGVALLVFLLGFAVIWYLSAGM